MKDNIESKNIGNRKIIIELRYNPVVTMLDKRGEITEIIENSNCFNDFFWEINSGEVIIRDHSEKEKAQNVIYVTFNKFNFISYKIDSIESFFSSFKKAYEALIKVLGKIAIRRIGCRIIGTYKVKSKSFPEILTHFKEAFPSQIFIEKYPVKDLAFTLEYENGSYTVGPIKDDNEHYFKHFDFGIPNKHIGIGIDTDNYITNEVKEINDPSLIKDIFILSLSVEKELFSNLINF